ncbi:MAG: hypothetical protein JSW46_10335 [Gemmatimonadota bacterium]|nr:MAG: hypothetical protein JSW46_10335 [Gemmatimonadota bacterium]
MRLRLTALLFVFAGLTLGHPMSSHAQGPGDVDEPGRWRFTVAPYLLFPYMDGSLTVRGIEVDVNAEPGDIFDKLQFGAMLYLEASNGTWGISLDGLYMDLEQTGERLELLTARMKQGAVELVGYRRVAEWAEVLLGGRLNVLSGSLVGEGGIIDAKDDKVFFDPFVGARLQVPNTWKWRLALRGDLGGFGVGSDFAWQIYPLVGYRFSRLFEVAIAYRWIDMDYKTGSAGEEFRYNMTIFGPEVGLLFHF